MHNAAVRPRKRCWGAESSVLTFSDTPIYMGHRSKSEEPALWRKNTGRYRGMAAMHLLQSHTALTTFTVDFAAVFV